MELLTDSEVKELSEKEKKLEKRILVTGGCGFIGSNFIRHLLNSEENYTIVNYDKLTYAGNLKNLEDLKHNPNYFFVKGDICNRKKVDNVMSEFDINYVVNFAAESHVDRSIENPEDFIRTNVEGTRVLLDTAKKHMIDRFVQIGTDEVYGSLGEYDKSSTEDDMLKPSSPYSASKASADLIALSYFNTYDLPVYITRSSNNYGAYQHPEKLIPLFITNILEGKKVPVYGDGKNIRDWIYVEDNCRKIERVIKNGIAGEIYNIGGGNEISNIQLTEMILRKMDFRDNWMEIVEFVDDRKGHDFRYSLNSSKIEDELGLMIMMPFEKGIEKTIEWYRQNENWWKPLKDKHEG